MDPLQWMGAVRMRVQTADKNNPITHTTPSINILWSENVHVSKEANTQFYLQTITSRKKNESSIHNTAFSREKVVWSESGEKYAQIKHRLQSNTVNRSK